jgi:hypothetical protein
MAVRLTMAVRYRTPKGLHNRRRHSGITVGSGLTPLLGGPSRLPAPAVSVTVPALAAPQQVLTQRGGISRTTSWPRP